GGGPHRALPRDRRPAAPASLPPAGRHRGGLSQIRVGAVQEGGDRRLALADGGRLLLHPGRGHDVRDRVARRDRVHFAAVLRLLRVLRHGHRTGPDAGFPAAGELRAPVLVGDGDGVLATLAHVAVAVVPRLRVHPAGR